MNYRKLISDHFSNMQAHKSSDKSGAIMALLAGLAIGGVLGVLFAPDSGRKIRERISDKAMNAADSVKEGFNSAKNNVKNKAQEISKEFEDFKNETKSGAKDVADQANEKIQNV
ncbi:MAG: YtxH domain-containing protein [Pedobacter sp.]|uniref:YtxH domain-containing protein n=1 Tax=Pedobacter sp. TaxID=1411316 RepID=UPI00356314AD